MSVHVSGTDFYAFLHHLTDTDIYAAFKNTCYGKNVLRVRVFKFSIKMKFVSYGNVVCTLLSDCLKRNFLLFTL